MDIPRIFNITESAHHIQSYLVTLVTKLWHRGSRQLRELRKNRGSEGEHEAGLDAVTVYYMAMPKR